MLGKRKPISNDNDENLAIERMSELEIAANLRPARALFPLIELLGDDVHAIKQYCSTSRDIRMACQDLEWYWRRKLLNTCRIYDQTKPSAFLQYVTSAVPNYLGGLGRCAVFDQNTFQVVANNCRDVYTVSYSLAANKRDGWQRQIMLPTNSRHFSVQDVSRSFDAVVHKQESDGVKAIGFSQQFPDTKKCTLLNNGKISILFLFHSEPNERYLISAPSPFVACDYTSTARGRFIAAIDDNHQLYTAHDREDFLSKEDGINSMKTLVFGEDVSREAQLFLLDNFGHAFKANFDNNYRLSRLIPIVPASRKQVVGLSPAFFLLEDGSIGRLRPEALGVEALMQEFVLDDPFVLVRSIRRARLEEDNSLVVGIGKTSGSAYFGVYPLNLGEHSQLLLTILPETENSIDCGIYSKPVRFVFDVQYYICVLSANNDFSVFQTNGQAGNITRIFKIKLM